MSETNEHPYDRLTPEVILSSVESAGYQCTGALLPLNSYENRVYRVDLEDPPEDYPGNQHRLAVKFYRPARWSNQAILEEHDFALELAEQEVPVVAPLVFDGSSLLEHSGFRFALFPWQPGRSPELNKKEDRELVGRYLGRLHAIAKTKPFEHRPAITVDTFGHTPFDYLMEHQCLPSYLEQPYQSVVQDLLQHIGSSFDSAQPISNQRLHGDCHLSNILWTETGPHIVDLDDCRMGPAVQDLWMFLSGERAEQELQLTDIMRGYQQFCDFDYSQLLLVESLRSLRLIHYSAWLAQRWSDPAFPIAFPWFDSDRYWEEQVLALREQRALLDEPPLQCQV